MIKYVKLSSLGYPKKYRVGTDGSVWSKKSGTWLRLSPRTRKDGYQRVCLYWKNSKRIEVLVHHLVLEAFIGSRPPGKEGCHYPDKNPSNNKVSNLKWGTKRLNKKHRLIQDGFSDRGEDNGRASLSNKQAARIKRLYSIKDKNNRYTGKKYTQQQLADRFHVSVMVINHIVNNLSYKKEWVS